MRAQALPRQDYWRGSRLPFHDRVCHGARRAPGQSIRVSVKSVNHRFLDVKLRCRNRWSPTRFACGRPCGIAFISGHVDIHVSVEPGNAAPVHVNQVLPTGLSAGRG